MMTVITAATIISQRLRSRDVTASPPARSRLRVVARRMPGDVVNLDGGGVVVVGLLRERRCSSAADRRTTNRSKRESSLIGAKSSSRYRGHVTTSSTSKEKDEDVRLRVFRDYFEQNSEGDTRLHVAVVQQLAILVMSLVKAAPRPSCLDVKNDAGQTPLHVAVLTRQADVARWLSDAGADAAARDRRGNTALHLACRTGDVDCVEALTRRRRKDVFIREIKPLTSKDETLVALSCRGRDSKTLVDPCQMEGGNTQGQDTKGRRDSVNVPVQVKDDSVGALKYYSLVGENTKVRRDSSREEIAIHSQSTETKVPKCICSEVVNTCVELFARNGDLVEGEPVTVDEISPRELSVVNYEGETCLHVAASHAHLDVVRRLVECGADPHARDAKSGNTVLHLALERGIDTVSRYLVEECDLDGGTVNYAGMTAYDVAREVSPALAGLMARTRGRDNRRNPTKRGKS